MLIALVPKLKKALRLTKKEMKIKLLIYDYEYDYDVHKALNTQTCVELEL